MVLMHLAYGVDLLSLTAGTALFVWCMKNPGKGSSLGKFFGFVVMALSVISMLCLFSCAMKGTECHKMSEDGMMMNANADNTGNAATATTPTTPKKKK